MICLLFILVFFLPSFSLGTDHPIVGILAQPVPQEEKCPNYGRSYLSAGYVKLLESFGARAVPIPYTMSHDSLSLLLRNLSGVVFPGGDYRLNLKPTPYYLTEKLIFDYALDANENGDFFPIWTECMGFEAIVNLVAGANVLDEDIHCFDESLPLQFTSDAKESRMYGWMTQDVLNILSTEAVTFNWHYAGLDYETFQSNTKLKNFFRLMSTNVWNGKHFVSSIESFKYPIYGIQWHPEKPLFEFNVPDVNINHSADSVLANSHIGRFVVSETRKCSHSFRSPEEENKVVIYNYPAVYTAINPNCSSLQGFDQCYFFA